MARCDGKGAMLEVRGLRSSVRAEPAAGMQHGRGVTVCALNSAATPKDDRGRTTQGDVVVDFLVRIPRGVRFVARTLKGNIEVTGSGAGLELQTYSGSLRLSAASKTASEGEQGDAAAEVAVSLREAQDGPAA